MLHEKIYAIAFHADMSLNDWIVLQLEKAAVTDDTTDVPSC